MRRSKTQGLSDVIQVMKKQYKLEHGMNQAHIIKSWESVVGKTAASYTDKIYFRGSELNVHISSPVLRQQLSGQRVTLTKRLNESLGENFISQIFIR